MQAEKRYRLNTTWHLTKAFWQSEYKKQAYVYLISLILLTLFIVALTVISTYWYRYFWDALQNYQTEEIIKYLGYFCILAAVFVASNVYQYYLQSIFCLHWRNWLTQTLVGSWLENKNYYYLETLKATTDNPDQRIQEDVDLFVSLTAALYLGLISAIGTILTFVVLLWSLSDVITVPLGHLGTWHIDGYLVWTALLYSLLGTYITHKMGKSLIFINFEKQRREADFRYHAVQLRQNVENIALYNSEKNEQNTLLSSFKHVIDITRQLIQRQKILLYFTSGFGQLAVIIPVLASMPLYFAKKIQIGGIMQILNAFGQVQSSFSFVVTSYTSIAQWRSVVLRLTGFVDHLAVAQNIKQTHQNLSKEMSTENAISGQSLAIKTQSGETLFQNLSIAFQPGKHYLLQGATGIGKSTLIKVLAGLWPFAEGVVTLPDGKKIMMLPQRTYMPHGNLRKALFYPEILDNASTLPVDLLKQFNLEKLIPSLDEIQNWGQFLSLGEQQKLAFIRIILLKPDWVFLDETSSALDLASEKKAYELLKENLPNCTIISIAHRQSLQAYHDEIINLDPQVA